MCSIHVKKHTTSSLAPIDLSQDLRNFHRSERDGGRGKGKKFKSNQIKRQWQRQKSQAVAESSHPWVVLAASPLAPRRGFGKGSEWERRPRLHWTAVSAPFVRRNFACHPVAFCSGADRHARRRACRRVATSNRPRDEIQSQTFDTTRGERGARRGIWCEDGGSMKHEA